MVVQGAFIGLGNTKISLYFGIIRMWLLRYIFIIITKTFYLLIPSLRKLIFKHSMCNFIPTMHFKISLNKEKNGNGLESL